MSGSERGGLADIVYVICLMQAAFLVLAGFGEVLLMGGNGAYLIVPLIKGAVLVWLAAKVVRLRRWALITLIVLQALTLAAIPVQFVIGLAPVVDFSPSLVELVTGIFVPMAVIAMSALLIGERRRALQAPPNVEPTFELTLAREAAR
jgi:LytS/YehU family sensor histidine kinase